MNLMTRTEIVAEAGKHTMSRIIGTANGRPLAADCLSGSDAAKILAAAGFRNSIDSATVEKAN